MRARHVWFVFAFVLGAAFFAETITEYGVMWGWYAVMCGVKAGAVVTATVLGILGFFLSWDNG